MELSEGASAQVSLEVDEADTAAALGSGDVPVLGTPRVVALVEEAAVAAVAPALESGQTTVGTRVELDHLTATPVGRTVVARARLAEVAGRRLTFEVSLHDGEVVAARGRVDRVVVDRQRFVEKAAGG
jgi:fluoroacetyl-CoA thioesterase